LSRSAILPSGLQPGHFQFTKSNFLRKPATQNLAKFLPYLFDKDNQLTTPSAELHNAGMATHAEQSSSRSFRPRAQRSYTESCDVEMEDDQPETSSDQDEDYKAQECDSDLDNSEDERVDSVSNATDDEAYISDNDDVNAVESEDEGPSPKRAKTADSESGDEEEGGENDEQHGNIPHVH
jgi:hypothetical protein